MPRRRPPASGPRVGSVLLLGQAPKRRYAGAVTRRCREQEISQADALRPQVGIDRTAVMRAVRSVDTVPEMTVRRLLHAEGYRFRLHRRELPGSPDIVFPSRRRAIFVHGCFWHGHQCARGARTPKSNQAYWLPKLRRNRERDAGAIVALTTVGWEALVVWECETGLTARGELLARLAAFLGPPGTSSKAVASPQAAQAAREP